MQIYGHRGASGTVPENTIPAFEAAIALGVSGIETDLHATSDDQLILIHDPSLRRTHGHPGDVRMMTLAEVRLAAADVPTLDELLELIGDRVHLDLEIKQPYLEELFLARLAAHPQVRWAVSCFDWRLLGHLRSLDAAAPLWLLSMDDRPLLWQTAAALGARGEALHDPAITATTIASARSAGLVTMAWTVNDPARAAELAALGVDILCTDHPERMIAPA